MANIGIPTSRRAATSTVRPTGNGMPSVTVAYPLLTQRVSQVVVIRVRAEAGACLIPKDAPQGVRPRVR